MKLIMNSTSDYLIIIYSLDICDYSALKVYSIALGSLLFPKSKGDQIFTRW